MPATRETLGFGVFASFNPNGVAPRLGRNPVGVEGFVGPLDPGSSAARPTLGYEARPRGGRRLVVFSIHQRLRRTHDGEVSWDRQCQTTPRSRARFGGVALDPTGAAHPLEALASKVASERPSRAAGTPVDPQRPTGATPLRIPFERQQSLPLPCEQIEPTRGLRTPMVFRLSAE